MYSIYIHMYASQSGAIHVIQTFGQSDVLLGSVSGKRFIYCPLAVQYSTSNTYGTYVRRSVYGLCIRCIMYVIVTAQSQWSIALLHEARGHEVPEDECSKVCNILLTACSKSLAY